MRVKQGKDCEIMKTLVGNENPGVVSAGLTLRPVVYPHHHHHHGLVGEVVVNKE